MVCQNLLCEGAALILLSSFLKHRYGQFSFVTFQEANSLCDEWISKKFRTKYVQQFDGYNMWCKLTKVSSFKEVFIQNSQKVNKM